VAGWLLGYQHGVWAASRDEIAGVNSGTYTLLSMRSNRDYFTNRRSDECRSVTEFVIYVVAVLGVLLASLLVKHTSGHLDYFRADKAWFYIVLLTIGYLGSRGLAKSGSRDHHNAPRD
jgi:hypothetical protein